MRFELPKDYKFLYKIDGCDYKADFDTNTIADKILCTRTKKVNQEIIRQLRSIGEENEINELILIDESKVFKIVKSLEALEIVKERKVNVSWLGKAKDLQEYNEGVCIYSYQALSQEEYDLLKECL